MEKFSELKYVRPDMERVMEELKGRIADMKAAKTYEEFRGVYMASVDADTELATMETVASIRNTINTQDPFYEKEMAFWNGELPKYQVIQKELSDIILESTFKQAFEAEFGRILIQNLEAKRRLSSEAVVADKAEEANLVSLYSKTSASATAKLRGETCNFYGLLKHMESTDRSERKEAFEAWAALYESIAPKLDEIYGKLVGLRAGMAKKLGFDSYTQMAYLMRRRYDYTAEDLKVFRRQVREVIVPACEKLFERQREALGVDRLRYYDESLSGPEGNPVPVGGKDYMVGKAQQMYRELSKESGEFFDFMVQYDLFDLETKPGKRMGGYSTSLPLYKAPFIFSNFNGTSADVDVLTHEAGHAFAGYTAARTQPLPELCHSTSEINEIHSMSMELWTYPWMESFFGGKAEQYRQDHLAAALKKIPYMVCVDEYQHAVFERPEMTAAERRKVWSGLEKQYMPWRDYDGNEFLEGGAFWMQKQHIFMYPFYYVDYAMAQIGAFEFYTKMKRDHGAAWADYYKLCQAGGGKGYFALLADTNLHNVLREGSVKEALKAVLEELGV